jgi:hypothetical protein
MNNVSRSSKALSLRLDFKALQRELELVFIIFKKNPS